MLTALLMSLTSCAQTHVAQKQGRSAKYANQEVKVWTRDLGRNFSSPALGPLFEVGDERIEELIAMLRDPDEEVRLGAQRMIRYLGNEKGMAALAQQWRASLPRVFTGAVPLPIGEIDYEIVDLDPRFLFALELDGSQRAKEKLTELEVEPKLRNAGWLIQAKCDKPRADQACLAKLVKENASWASPSNDDVHVKVLGYSSSGEKVLAELVVGQFFTEGFYVVLERRPYGDGRMFWRFYSITPAWVS